VENGQAPFLGTPACRAACGSRNAIVCPWHQAERQRRWMVV